MKTSLVSFPFVYSAVGRLKGKRRDRSLTVIAKEPMMLRDIEASASRHQIGIGLDRNLMWPVYRDDGRFFTKIKADKRFRPPIPDMPLISEGYRDNLRAFEAVIDPTRDVSPARLDLVPETDIHSLSWSNRDASLSERRHLVDAHFAVVDGHLVTDLVRPVLSSCSLAGDEFSGVMLWDVRLVDPSSIYRPLAIANADACPGGTATRDAIADAALHDVPFPDFEQAFAAMAHALTQDSGNFPWMNKRHLIDLCRVARQGMSDGIAADARRQALDLVDAVWEDAMATSQAYQVTTQARLSRIRETLDFARCLVGVAPTVEMTARKFR